MRQVCVSEAPAQFSKLLEQVQGGEGIVITRNGKPIVRLLPLEQPKRLLGRWQGMVPVATDDDWARSDEAVGALFAASVGRPE